MRARLLGILAAVALVGPTYAHADWHHGHYSHGWGISGGSWYAPGWGCGGGYWKPPVSINIISTGWQPASYYYPYTTAPITSNTNVFYQPVYTNSVLTKAQIRLYNLGYYKGTIDGVFGPATQRAIEIFQRANSLPITGRLDLQTLQRLKIHV